MTARQEQAWIETTATTKVLKSDIYNINAALKRKKLQGLSATDALIKDLKDRGIPYAIKVDDDNRVTHLFITTQESLKLAQRNQDVILADCTYNMNKFNIPLLHLVGT